MAAWAAVVEPAAWALAREAAETGAPSKDPKLFCPQR